MITDDQVIQLYQCLLGRDPENAGTISAFKSYYPTLERGRRAIFTSAEFTGFYARVTGRMASTLAVELLERASAMEVPAEEEPANLAMRAGMQLFYPADSVPRFVVAVGMPAGLRLDDLAPLGSAEAAILHVAPGFPPAMPLFGRLADGTAVSRISGDAETIGHLLQGHGRRIDALYLLDASAGPQWVDRLRRHFTDRALVVWGLAQAGFDPVSLDEEVRQQHFFETPVDFQGLRISQVGGWVLPVDYVPPAWVPPAPDRGAYPALALAAIVRNEAVCVENMLRSVAPVVSYVAVLDTGSDDATPELAQRFLAQSGVPFAVAARDRAAFGDDFSAMRNAALAMVPDWVRWVLMLDADEELAAEDYPALLELLAEADDSDAECFALPRYNYTGLDKSGPVTGYPDIQIRLLRHTPDRQVVYSGAVHETVRVVPHIRLPLDAAALGGARGGPHIHHLVRRFRTAAEEARKQDFYREIAARAPEEPTT